MNYDYKVINTNSGLAFAKRALLYTAILSSTVALALVVLFILFERYLFLILPGCMILYTVITFVLTGRSPGVYLYHFAPDALKIEGKGAKNVVLSYKKIAIIKNAEKSEFLDKNIIKYAFSECRIILKNTVNNSLTHVYLITYDEKRYLIALDEYAETILRGAMDETDIL